MNWLKILSVKERKELGQKLKKQFGIEGVPGLIVKKGKERLFLFCGGFNPKQIKEIEQKIIIERVGIYLGKLIEDEVRLSIEGTQLLKNQITKNIFELDTKQVEQWMLGSELNISTGKRGFLVMKYKDNYLGCGKASELKIGNFVPKSRRLKYKN